MATAQPMYHAPTFEPTVDELETLKLLELGQPMGIPESLKQHLSGRLLDWGYVAKSDTGVFSISELGRKLVRRQNN